MQGVSYWGVRCLARKHVSGHGPCSSGSALTIVINDGEPAGLPADAVPVTVDEEPKPAEAGRAPADEGLAPAEAADEHAQYPFVLGREA